MGVLVKPSEALLRDIAELRRRVDGETITDESATRLLRYIHKQGPGVHDVVGIASDALLLLRRPRWLEALVGPRGNPYKKPPA
jgi:hypothetical protein